MKTEVNQETNFGERKNILSKEKQDNYMNKMNNNPSKNPKDIIQKDNFENKTGYSQKGNVNILNINNNYNYNFNNQTSTSPQNHTNYNPNKNTNVLSTKSKNELNKIYLPSNYNTTHKGSNSPEIRKNVGTSPTTNQINKININNNYYTSSNVEKTNLGNQDLKKIPTGKGLNIIPLKNMNNLRENSPNYNAGNDRAMVDRISPKTRDMKLPTTNLSPENIYMPTSTKNSTSEKINFEMKFGNKLNMNNKSPSPKHADFISRLNKKSPDTKK